MRRLSSVHCLVEGDSSLGVVPSTAVSRPGLGSRVSPPTRCVPRGGPRPRLRAWRPYPVEDDLEPVEKELEWWLSSPGARHWGWAGRGARAQGSGRAGRRPLSGLRLSRTPARGQLSPRPS